MAQTESQALAEQIAAVIKTAQNEYGRVVKSVLVRTDGSVEVGMSDKLPRCLTCSSILIQDYPASGIKSSHPLPKFYHCITVDCQRRNVLVVASEVTPATNIDEDDFDPDGN